MATDPLAGLDDVDWKKLKHAYGKATDVPEQLRAFATGDAGARAKAAFGLSASLCHQGSVTAATTAAVPFILRLAAAPGVSDRHLLLRIAGAIATFDDHMQYLLGGIHEPKAWPKKPNVQVRTFLAVRDAAAVALPMLDAPEPETRASAAFLLAWTAIHAEAAAPALARALSRETEPRLCATLAIALGFAAGYLETAEHDAALRALVAGGDRVVATGAAIALSTAHSGEVDDATFDALADGCSLPAPRRHPPMPGVDPPPKTPEEERDRLLLPFGDGNLGDVAARVLAPLSRLRPTGLARLLQVIERGGGGAPFAANVLLRTLFDEAEPIGPPSHVAKGRYDAAESAHLAKVKLRPDDLSTEQRRLLRALADVEEARDGALHEGLTERGLPTSRALLGRWLGDPAPRSALDAPVTFRGQERPAGDVLTAMIGMGEAERRAAAVELVASLGSARGVALLIAGIVEIADFGDAAYDLALAVGPGAESELLALSETYERNGPPTREQPAGGTIRFVTAGVAVGLGLAAAALARGAPAAPCVDRALQQTYGFHPRVRDALSALPPERRDAWLLDPKRDDRDQPAESFQGAWPYWVAYPSPAVTARVLALVPTWKPNDAWGAKRRDHADPLLREYAAALRARGDEADARRCEEALARLS